ncbi:MAG: hypothetical protein LBI13_10440 [Streptococcaceae bacterium]|jgi:hypothetical protein|nr:hypothetical protein [Streptococcaceae bacterium]
MKFSRKGLIFFITALLGFAIVIYNYSQQAEQRLGNSSDKIERVTPLDADGKSAKAVFEKTLKASNEKDITTYVSCLIPKARKNTAAQMSEFFKKQNITNSLESYRVLKKQNGHLLAEAKVKSINNTKNQKEYRDNIATIDVSYAKQNGEWLIDLTSTVDTQLLKK